MGEAARAERDVTFVLLCEGMMGGVRLRRRDMKIYGVVLAAMFGCSIAMAQGTNSPSTQTRGGWRADDMAEGRATGGRGADEL